MHIENKKYDLIMSLGGNCAAAHNLLYRQLRSFALPFDWVFIEDEQPILYLVEGFSNKFEKLCLYKNLQEITDESLVGAHGTFVPYKDTYTGFNFVNHFDKKLEKISDYQPAYNKLCKRVSRLFKALDEGEDFLFILSSRVQISCEVIKKLSDALTAQYPNKHFDFYVLLFNASKNDLQISGNIKINFIRRDLNLYDFTQTNFEWSFLDKVELKRKNKKIKQASFKLFKTHYKITVESFFQ